MHIARINDVGKNFTYQWPTPAGTETFDYFVEYVVMTTDGQHVVKVGFCKRRARQKS